MTHHLHVPLFTNFSMLELPQDVFGCGVGTKLHEHNFVVVPEITTRVTACKHICLASPNDRYFVLIFLQN